MKTTEMISVLNEIVESRDYTQDWEDGYDEVIVAVIKTLKEYDRLVRLVQKYHSYDDVKKTVEHLEYLMTNIVKE